LTFLIGENSTGKTSFLAMIQALWNMTAFYETPVFKEIPYDLGSFDEIAHHRGRRGGRAKSFQTGFCTTDKHGQTPTKRNSGRKYEFRFEKRGPSPFPVFGRADYKSNWFTWSKSSDKSFRLTFRTRDGMWEKDFPDREWFSPVSLLRSPVSAIADPEKFSPKSNSSPFTEEDRASLFDIGTRVWPIIRPSATLPFRSKPERTYNPSLGHIADPEGQYVVMALAELSYSDDDLWTDIKRELEEFGRVTGLFDEIRIFHLGKNNSEPYQVHVKKHGGKLKGPWRNLVDVGYGVSQFLQIAIHLWYRDNTPLYLWQQPEIHLHPSAQAGLGSLLCHTAKWTKQFIVETHSEYLVDRVRMDIRDGIGNLNPEDVSILFFEPNGLDVTIHSLGINKQGDIFGFDGEVPKSYGSFFMSEMDRSLGM